MKLQHNRPKMARCKQGFTKVEDKQVKVINSQVTSRKREGSRTGELMREIVFQYRRHWSGTFRGPFWLFCASVWDALLDPVLRKSAHRSLFLALSLSLTLRFHRITLSFREIVGSLGRRYSATTVFCRVCLFCFRKLLEAVIQSSADFRLEIRSHILNMNSLRIDGRSHWDSTHTEWRMPPPGKRLHTKQNHDPKLQIKSQVGRAEKLDGNDNYLRLLTHSRLGVSDTSGIWQRNKIQMLRRFWRKRVRQTMTIRKTT
jgi:hypothetical protein